MDAIAAIVNAIARNPMSTTSMVHSQPAISDIFSVVLEKKTAADEHRVVT
jgi:hypothetical protein